jgi:Tfp pilus assembly protein PilX
MNMTLRNKSQRGFAHPLALLLVLVVVAGIAFAGWRVVQNQNKTTATSVPPSAPTAAAPATAPSTIANSADLNQAQAALNQTDVDTDLNPNAYSADVSSLL